VEVIQGNSRIVAPHSRHRVAPQLRDFEYVRLIHGRDPVAPTPRRGEGDPCHPLDLDHRIGERVDCAGLASPAWLAIVQPARELAHDQQVLTPRRRSGLRGERPTRAGRTDTGRRFANTPSRARSASSPVSGRRCQGAWSSAGSPTAPSSTASARVTPARVASGSGSPAAATPAAPTANRWRINLIPNRSPTTSRTCSASATTSGPIPSPGSTAIVYGLTTGLPSFVPVPLPGSARTLGSGPRRATSVRFRPN